MILNPISRTRGVRGSTLVVVLVLCSVTLLVVASTLQWTTTNTVLTQRNNQYFRTVAAAEAATEKVISKLAYDYQQNGDALVFANLASYRQMIPTKQENPWFESYDFNDGQNQQNRTYIEFIPPSEFRVLSSQYRGLHGYASAFRVISNARDKTSRFDVVGAVRQDVEVATIPLFQFAIFYNLDLEINPGPVMTVTGPVHCNQDLFLEPQATLTFEGDVTAAGDIVHHKKPGDPSNRGNGGTVKFMAEHDGGVSSLNLPIGTNNSAAAVREVVEIPPGSEAVSSAMGKERFYNKADVIILVKDSGVTMTSGRVNNMGTTVPESQYNSFLRTDVSFFNKRENKTVKAVQIDIAALRTWNQNNTLLRPVLPQQDIRIIYVDDQRTQTAATQPGVRLVNGTTILPKGLTVVTPDPLYVKGHYNAPGSVQGTANTVGTLPAALIGDAITVLSPSWNDANSSKALGSRIASATTVNAAFLAGIVETVSGSYSGGVENFPRFLEDWGGKTFTYNGSMVVMFDSKVATGAWRGTGAGIGIYNPPKRNWAFDQNFRDINKIPPGTPSVRALIRGSWAMVRPNTTSVVTTFD